MAWILTVATALLVPNIGWSRPEDPLDEAERLYRDGNYRDVVELLRPQLYPTIQLSSQDDVLRAQKLLGISYLFLNEEEAAKAEFRALLSQRPDYRFDPYTDPVVAVETLEQVKRENDVELRRILEQEQRDRQAEAERSAAEKQRQEELRELSQTVVEKTVHERHYWINFVPFGAGQFQNGQTTKGYVLLGLEAGLAALSIGTAIALRVSYDDGQVPSDEWSMAQTLQLTQLISGGLCIATMLYGIGDALLNYTPEDVTVREYQKPIAKINLVPQMSVGGAGLGLAGVF